MKSFFILMVLVFGLVSQHSDASQLSQEQQFNIRYMRSIEDSFDARRQLAIELEMVRSYQEYTRNGGKLQRGAHVSYYSGSSKPIYISLDEEFSRIQSKYSSDTARELVQLAWDLIPAPGVGTNIVKQVGSYTIGKVINTADENVNNNFRPIDISVLVDHNKKVAQMAASNPLISQAIESARSRNLGYSAKSNHSNSQAVQNLETLMQTEGIRGDLSNLAVAFDSRLGKVETEIAKVSEHIQRQESEADILDQQKRAYSEKIKAQKEVVGTISLIGHLATFSGDEKTAELAYGSAEIIAQGFDLANSAAEMGTMALTSGYVGLTIAAINMFSNTGKKDAETQRFEAIMGALTAMQKQLNKRFDRVEDMLKDIKIVLRGDIDGLEQRLIGLSKDFRRHREALEVQARQDMSLSILRGKDVCRQLDPSLSEEFHSDYGLDIFNQNSVAINVAKCLESLALATKYELKKSALSRPGHDAKAFGVYFDLAPFEPLATQELLTDSYNLISSFPVFAAGPFADIHKQSINLNEWIKISHTLKMVLLYNSEHITSSDYMRDNLQNITETLRGAGEVIKFYESVDQNAVNRMVEWYDNFVQKSLSEHYLKMANLAYPEYRINFWSPVSDLVASSADQNYKANRPIVRHKSMDKRYFKLFQEKLHKSFPISLYMEDPLAKYILEVGSLEFYGIEMPYGKRKRFAVTDSDTFACGTENRGKFNGYTHAIQDIYVDLKLPNGKIIKNIFSQGFEDEQKIRWCDYTNSIGFPSTYFGSIEASKAEATLLRQIERINHAEIINRIKNAFLLEREEAKQSFESKMYANLADAAGGFNPHKGYEAETERFTAELQVARGILNQFFMHAYGPLGGCVELSNWGIVDSLLPEIRKENYEKPIELPHNLSVTETNRSLIGYLSPYNQLKIRLMQQTSFSSYQTVVNKCQLLPNYVPEQLVIDHYLIDKNLKYQAQKVTGASRP